MNLFEEPYQKRNCWDLDTQESELVMARVFQIGDNDDVELRVMDIVQREVRTIISKYFVEERAVLYREDYTRARCTGLWSSNTIEMISWGIGSQMQCMKCCHVNPSGKC